MSLSVNVGALIGHGAMGRTGRRLDNVFAVIALLSLVLAVLVNLVTYYPPLQDFGDWIYQGYLIKALLAGTSVPAEFKHWPVPNVVSQLLLAALNSVFTPIAASKVFISLYLVVAGWLMWLLAQRADRTVDGARFLLLVCLAIIHAPYWTGEMNYQVGLLVLFSYFLRHRRSPAENAAVDIVYSLVLFFCHAICLAVFLTLVGWRALLNRRIAQGLITVLPVVALLAWYVLADPHAEFNPAATPELRGITALIAYRGYVFAKIGPYQNMVFDNAGDFDRAPSFFLLGVVVNFLFAASMAMFFIMWVAKSTARRTWSPELMTAIVCCIVAIFDPSRKLGITNVGERFIYPAVILVVISFQVPSAMLRLSAFLSAFLVVFLAHALIVLPKGTEVGGVPGNGIVNEPGARYHVLFWHRPFWYLDSAAAAQISAISGRPPTLPIVFPTSMLADRGADRNPVKH
jgi:hypothetical protein